VNPAAKSPAGLDSPLQYLRGVGPQRARLLERLGLLTVRDALNHFPRDYQDRRSFVLFHKLALGESGVVQGTVFGVSAPPRRISRAPTKVVFRDQTGYFTALWFGRPYLAQQLKRDQRVVLYGKKGFDKDRHIVLDNPDYEIVEDDEMASIHMGRVVPVYPLTEGVFQRWLRGLLYQVVTAHAEETPDILPEALREQRSLLPAAQAYRTVHFPDRLEEVDAARRRFAFEDFLVLQVGLALRRRQQARVHGRPLAPPGALVARLLGDLPFTVTAAQERVWSEIRADLARPVPMNRLLQGDVGSGKTIVAVMALLTAVEAGCQAVLMAPTEILAEQHVRTVRGLVEPLGLTVAWLSAGQRARERQAALEALRSGAAAIGVGTHALIEDAVELQRLGLAVVDEQHRFGVMHRALIRGKGEHPHVLVMTATPIPRTLALTLYGDLDVSVLDELPPGRTPIVTKVRYEPHRQRIYDFVRDELRAGRQAYVVCPLVEETEASDLKAATEMAERLQAGPFKEFRVGLVHGRLSFDEKDQVMRAFKAGQVDLLVATTVIEVGIDVPNASVMLIEHAERFGLAQLHQLRGRVGRGAAKSYCVLLASGPMSDEGKQRLEAMEATQDGFRLAEVDLKIRGPGEFFGTRQSGLPEFRTASLVTHTRLLEEARQDAAGLVARDPGLRLPEHRPLREALVARWRERLELASVG
jgi:ATP-dependent DNA helicase RecG